MHLGDVLGGRFRIDRPVRSGGMGVVYRAVDQSTGALAAVKVLGARHGAAATRFAEEARTLATLHHRGIVRYIAHGETQLGEPYLAMEWLDGEDLAERLTRSVLTVAEAVALARSAAEALAAAHARGVVHRDIKPSNLFLERGAVDRVKLLDFGIARAADVSRRLTQTGMVMGTPGYISPEQARGERADARADVFSLGAVLFECLTGKPAFVGYHVMAVLAKLLLEEPPRLRALREDVPPALDDLVTRMLAKEREQRPRDAAALLAELEAMDAPIASETRAVSRTTRRPAALTDGEQRLVSVIVAAEPGGPTLDDASDSTVPIVAGAAGREQIEAVIRSYGARIEALAGQAVLVALIGTGNARDRAAQAARCALALRSLLPTVPMALVTGWESSGQLPMGQVLDRASSLLQSSLDPPPDDRPRQRTELPVRLDDVTRALLDATFDVAEVPGGWDLGGEHEVAPGMRRLLGKPTPCIGRDRELGELNDLLDDCVTEGRAQAVLVTGVAGVGKSRVRSELVRRVQTRMPHVSVWLGRADPMGAGSSFAVIGSALRHALGITGAEPVAERRTKLSEELARRLGADAGARAAEFLGEIVGAPFPDEHSPKLRAARQSAPIMADGIRRAWEEFIVAECAGGPVLLVLEDLHWGDAPSTKLVDLALRRLAERPFMVLALARPEVHDLFPKLWAERSVQEIRLGELPRKAAEQLARFALGDAVSCADVARVVERAAGNAFYLEELIRAVADGRGQDLPETVLAMVGSRLAALDAEARRVLRAASIFGATFWRGGVAAMLGGDEASAEVDAQLEMLVEREIVVRLEDSKLSGQEELVFRHALLRDGAYAMLTAEDRALGHKLAGEWLERAGEGDPAVLAEHFEQGEELARAAAWYEQAAQQALQGDDLPRVAAWVEKGLQCGAEGELRARMLIAHARVLARWGRHAEGLALLEQAQGLSQPGRRSWCVAVGARIAYAVILARFDAAAEAMRGLLAVEPEPDAIGALILAYAFTGEALTWIGQTERARLYVARIQELAARVEGTDLRIVGWVNLARSLPARHAHADFWQASQFSRASAESFEAAGDRYSRNMARVHLGMDLYMLGDYEQAEAVLREVVDELHDERGFMVSLAHVTLALALTTGGSDEKLNDVEALLAARAGDFVVQSTVHRCTALIHLRRGDLAAAEREARAALDQMSMYQVERVWAVTTFADVLLRSGRLEEALGAARRAEAMTKQLTELDWVDSYTQAVCAEALIALGQPEQAREALHAGRDFLLKRASAMDPASRSIYLDRNEPNARLLALARTLLD